MNYYFDCESLKEVGLCGQEYAREETEFKKLKLQEEIEEFGSEATQLQNEIENLKDKLKVYKEEKKTKLIEIDNIVIKLNGYEDALSKIVESAQIMSQVSEKKLDAIIMTFQNGNRIETNAHQLIDCVNEVVSLMEEEKMKKAQVQKEIDDLGDSISDLESVLMIKEKRFTELSKIILSKTTDVQNCQKTITDIDEGITKLTECTKELLNLMKNS